MQSPKLRIPEGQGSEKNLCPLVIILARVPSAFLSPGCFHLGLNSHVARELLTFVKSYKLLHEPVSSTVSILVRCSELSHQNLLPPALQFSRGRVGLSCPQGLCWKRQNLFFLIKTTPQQVHWCLIFCKVSYSYIQFRCTTH